MTELVIGRWYRFYSNSTRGAGEETHIGELVEIKPHVDDGHRCRFRAKSPFVPDYIVPESYIVKVLSDDDLAYLRRQVEFYPEVSQSKYRRMFRETKVRGKRQCPPMP